jgi:hypothetical protein
MRSPSNAEIFISYAWKDDQPFVEGLNGDLLRFDYDPWVDKEKMPSRGWSLAREVLQQLRACDRLIAVIGPAAITSEACLAQRAVAFNGSKVVTATLRLGDYRMAPPEPCRCFGPGFQVSRPSEAALDELQRVLKDSPVFSPLAGATHLSLAIKSCCSAARTEFG